MNNILIIEDEEPAAKRLQKLITEIEPDSIFEEPLVSIDAAVKRLEEGKHPDLIFSDIQLSDGSSFEIFKKVSISCPIIFVTAFDQYAIDAFKVNSIDYLLKPVKKEELKAALEKFNRFSNNQARVLPDIQNLVSAIGKKEFKSRFIVRYGEHIKTVKTDEVAYFYTEDKINFLMKAEDLRLIKIWIALKMYLIQKYFSG